MSFTKILAGIFIIVSATIFAYFLINPNTKEYDAHEGMTSLMSSSSELVFENKPEASETDVLTAIDSGAIPSLWQTSAKIDNLPNLRSDINDAELVSYQRAFISQLSSGSKVELFIPQLGQSMNVLITSSERLASGNVSLKGHLESNSLFSFVMTLGKKSMFATVGTPGGIFNVSGNQDFAWVIPAASLKKLMDTNVPDYRSAPETENLPSTGNG
ncbi:MAG: hypothetical protein ACI9FB_000740 [Candidatus Azotimanducaceae bacterium]|jgi:hypothetical protein